MIDRVIEEAIERRRRENNPATPEVSSWALSLHTCVCVVLIIVIGKQCVVLRSHGSVDEMLIFEFF